MSCSRREQVAYGGSAAPAGWLLCDGASYLQSAQQTLFDAIGTAYGSVDGTHFNVPDLRGRVPAGIDGGTGRLPGFTSRGVAGGAASGVLQYHVHGGVDHLHSVPDHYHHGDNNQSIAMANWPAAWSMVGEGPNFIGITSWTGSMDAARNTGAADRALTTGGAGDNSGVNNVQPAGGELSSKTEVTKCQK
jgi:microcystin-dependent protein